MIMLKIASCPEVFKFVDDILEDGIGEAVSNRDKKDIEYMAEQETNPEIKPWLVKLVAIWEIIQEGHRIIYDRIANQVDLDHDPEHQDEWDPGLDDEEPVGDSDDEQ